MALDEWGDEIIEETPSTEIPTEETPAEEAPSDSANESEISAGWDINDAVEYITYNAIDNEDFIDSDDIAKVKFLNVARRTLQRKYPALEIPLHAEYLFGAALAVAFNDTNKLQQQGVASFSVKGISFTFKDWAKKGLDALIPQEVIALIAEENGVSLGSGRTVRAVTL